MKKSFLILFMILTMLTANIGAPLSALAENDGFYVVVSAPDGGVNMRSGPGENNDKVLSGLIPNGTELFISVTSGTWGFTAYSGATGWITLKQVTRLDEPTPPQPQEPEYTSTEANYTVYVATPDGGLNMRTAPAENKPLAMNSRIPDGTPLFIERVSGNNWGYTSYNGIKGWVALSQTTKTPPKANPDNEPETQEPEETEKPKGDEEEPAKPQEEETVKPVKNDDGESEESEKDSDTLFKQIILIATLVLLAIFIIALIAVALNTKSGNKKNKNKNPYNNYYNQ